jgi:hypothetical protein
MTLLGHVSLNDKTTIVATQIAEKDDGNSSAHEIFTNKICRPSTLHTRTRILRLFLKVGAFILKIFLIVIRVKIFTRSRILKFYFIIQQSKIHTVSFSFKDTSLRDFYFSLL